jgi:hypothetical protein
MIEPEIAFADLSDNATLAEQLLKFTFETLLNKSHIRPELGVREYSSGFSLTGVDVTNLAPAAPIGWGFSLRRPVLLLFWWCRRTARWSGSSSRRCLLLRFLFLLLLSSLRSSWFGGGGLITLLSANV